MKCASRVNIEGKFRWGRHDKMRIALCLCVNVSIMQVSMESGLTIANRKQEPGEITIGNT